MTAFAACLFALAALVSAHVIAMSWLRHGTTARGLPASLRSQPQTTLLKWNVVERERSPLGQTLPALATLRKERAARPRRQLQWNAAERPGLEWPGIDLDVELAA